MIKMAMQLNKKGLCEECECFSFNGKRLHYKVQVATNINCWYRNVQKPKV